jgi:predicted acyltransferase
MVYSSGILLSLVLLPPTVFVVSALTGNPRTAPYIAGVLLLSVQAVLSFLGHKKFTFGRAGGASAETDGLK